MWGTPIDIMKYMHLPRPVLQEIAITGKLCSQYSEVQRSISLKASLWHQYSEKIIIAEGVSFSLGPLLRNLLLQERHDAFVLSCAACNCTPNVKCLSMCKRVAHFYGVSHEATTGYYQQS